MTTQLQTILVFGATGAQGGSVLRHLQKNNHFQLRGLTRDPKSEQSQDLQKKGIEMVCGDISSLDNAVFKDVDGVFLLTNFWDSSQMGKEFEYGKAIVDQAIQSGVRAIIFSSLANVQHQSNNKYLVPHFTDKARLEDYIRSKEKNFEHISFVLPGFYYENFINKFRITKDSSGNLALTLPQCKQIHAVSVDEIGLVVALMFADLEKFHRQSVAFFQEIGSDKYFIEMLSKKLGKPVHLNSLSVEQYSKLPFPGAKEIAHMMGWMDEFGYYGNLDVTSGKALLGSASSLRSFEKWLETVKPEDLC